MQSIYSYTDYRAFLRDAYQLAKRRNPKFSYRYFARKAGYASPNFLKLVAEGKRNLTIESAERFAEVFGLGRREKRFFVTLVQFNQAGTAEEQHHHFQHLLAFPEYNTAQELAAEQYEYLTHWYYPVIQDLVALPDFVEDPAWIAQRLRGAVTPAKARKAIEVLCRLGLLVRDERNFLQPTQTHWSTGDVPRSAAAYTYHEQMLERAAVALREQSPREREFGAVTIAVDREQLAQLKTAIRDFRRVVLHIAGQSPTQKAIYQMNIQLFGHTQWPEDGECDEGAV